MFLLKIGQEAGVETFMISQEKISELMPYMKTDDIIGGCFTPVNSFFFITRMFFVVFFKLCKTDCTYLPSELANAYVFDGRKNGVEYFENTVVNEVLINQQRIEGVRGDDFIVEAPGKMQHKWKPFSIPNWP